MCIFGKKEEHRKEAEKQELYNSEDAMRFLKEREGVRYNDRLAKETNTLHRFLQFDPSLEITGFRKRFEVNPGECNFSSKLEFISSGKTYLSAYLIKKNNCYACNCSCSSTYELHVYLADVLFSYIPNSPIYRRILNDEIEIIRTPRSDFHKLNCFLIKTTNLPENYKILLS